jgi:hypothetical protein
VASLARSTRRYFARPYLLPASVSRLRFIQLFVEASLRRLKMSLGAYDPLTRLATKHRSDKGVTIFPFMGYTIQYDRLFGPFRDRSINILEVGLGPRQLSTCPSLKMWADYFPKANIYGFDICDFSDVELPRTRIFRGDQGKPEDLLKVIEHCPKFDIIVEDGSHASFHQQMTLKTLFPYLADDGLFVIEDLLYQPPELEAQLPSVRKTRELLKDRPALDEMIEGVKDVTLLDMPIRGAEEGTALITKQANHQH